MANEQAAVPAKKTKLCRHCKTEIDAMASRCPHCHGKNYVWTRSRKVLLGAIILFVGYAIISSTTSSSPSSSTSAPAATQAVASNPQAAQELKDLMAQAEKADLVSSYDFSGVGVVYVTGVWYTMNVSFKKDFMAKIATLRNEINGRRYVEIRDDHTDEKVGEVTAFSGSIEVYK